MSLLRREQVDEFFERGYAVVRDVFQPAEIGEMCAAFRRLREEAGKLSETTMHRGSRFVIDRDGPAGLRIHRIVWCGGAEATLSDYGRDPRLVRMASVLLGSWEMQQLINQAHFKLPHDGVEFPWHQDSAHRRYGGSEWRDVNGRGSYVQTIVALDDVTEENGPLMVIPGSCKMGHVKLAQSGIFPPELIDEDAARPALMKAGSVLLLGPYTLHRSSPNQSAVPRRLFINGYAYPGANSRIYPGAGSGRLVHAGARSPRGRRRRVARGLPARRDRPAARAV